MSTRRRGAAASLLAGLLLAPALAGCSGGDDAPPVPGAPASGAAGPTTGAADATASPGAPTVPPVPTDLPRLPADLAGQLQGLLDQRATAVLARDRAGFLSGVASTPSLRTTEGGYFDNLAQLPLGAFGYRLIPASLVRAGDSYWGVVEVTMQLSPYDAAPVRTLDRFRFVPSGPAFLVGSTTDRAWEAENRPVQQPWETEPVQVREAAGVLGVFDSADPREAAGVLGSVQRGLADVAGRVPYREWGAQVVVYALSDPRFLDSFDDLPGGDPADLGGVAFTVPAGTDDTTVASTRVALNPDLLTVAAARKADPQLDRLVRHELVHVAVGTHDDTAPVWLSEGIAEWVSVQALPPDRRDVPDRAVSMAADGRLTTMPTDAAFNDDDASVHYALAWWACEWLAQTYDPAAPFTLLEAFERGGPRADPREVVRDVVGVSVDALARRGAALLAQTYAPPPSPSPGPSGGPSAGPGAGAPGETPTTLPTGGPKTD